MKFEIINAPHKLATFWISREEAEDKAFMTSLKPQFKLWKEKGYLPVVYESGTGSLQDSLYQLIKHNNEVIAKNQLTAEQKML